MPPPPADHDTDLLIVGAGPTGLFAAYYAGFRGLAVTVMDSLPEPGGQINAMYPEKQIFDIAGFPAVRGRELVDRLLEQAAPYDPYHLLGHRAETLERTAEGSFAVTTQQGVRVRARAVLITGGIGTFTPRPLPAAAAYEGAGLAYFVRRPDDYAGQDVVIVGGGDSAFDWALTLHPLAASVTLVHRRDSFRAHPTTVAAVRAAGVEIITEAELTKVADDGRGMDAVEITRRDGRTHRLPCRRIIAALGFTANLGPLLAWGIDIANRRHIPVDSAMRTSVPGIYAAGDINDYPGKVRLIAVGFGEAATAVNNAAHHIDPEQPVFPGHSTDVPTAAPAAA
ncbi:NAD(P)/FAD-dependent oxidoreductase [Streptomyces sporangiiformans]|uniref:Ferredoxin--NADP reductase n=1 Tax=Streptomyces sporangiiformans TaxID=2315329 RepID=A0A505D8N6_9ACTN|nr:NAD(P)/FAD-dependent oxidoreductase [Streptomyces sporangiiformans]TPQ18145.1 NAD(P)/FAD-dependent oxidoreductase [Streptomyces sporangiiformans]